MERVENLRFEGEEIPVDGKGFANCRFVNSTLLYGGGPQPTFEGCRFENVSLQFQGEAVNTLKFLTGLSTNSRFRGAVDRVVRSIRGS
jgi:hypothetical protein